MTRQADDTGHGPSRRKVIATTLATTASINIEGAGLAETGVAGGRRVPERRLPVPDTISPELAALVGAQLAAGWDVIPKDAAGWRALAAESAGTVGAVPAGYRRAVQAHGDWRRRATAVDRAAIDSAAIDSADRYIFGEPAFDFAGLATVSPAGLAAALAGTGLAKDAVKFVTVMALMDGTLDKAKWSSPGSVDTF